MAAAESMSLRFVMVNLSIVNAEAAIRFEESAGVRSDLNLLEIRS